jgi:hypothetical protein
MTTALQEQILPFVLANSKPCDLEQYEENELGHYDPVEQIWRGNIKFQKSSTMRNVTSTYGTTSDSDLQSDMLGN